MSPEETMRQEYEEYLAGYHGRAKPPSFLSWANSREIDRKAAEAQRNDPITHPKHYTSHPSGIECVEITRHMTYNLGTAVAYIWRHKLKNGIEDLKKARWHLDDEIKRLEAEGKTESK